MKLIYYSIVITLSLTHFILIYSYNNNILSNNKELNNNKLGIVIIDHGSRKNTANEMLIELCNRYKSKYSFEIVEPAHMEICEPSILTACERCINQGAKRIICHPYFLSKGRHVQEDIPNIINNVKSKYPNIDISLTEPVGCNDMMIEIINSSIVSSINKS